MCLDSLVVWPGMLFQISANEHPIYSTEWRESLHFIGALHEKLRGSFTVLCKLVILSDIILYVADTRKQMQADHCLYVVLAIKLYIRL